MNKKEQILFRDGCLTARERVINRNIALFRLKSARIDRVCAAYSVSMQIYEYVSCFFVGFALSLLALYLSGIKRKSVFYFFAVNSAGGFLSSLFFIAAEKADGLFVVTGGFSGITGQLVLSILRLTARLFG